jgi:hypothetical protein
VVWTAPNASELEQSLLLSTDGGSSFQSIAEHVSPAAQSYSLLLPRLATTKARIRLVAVDPGSHNFIFAGSRADFSIGVNVNSAVEVGFVASEKLDVNWSDTSFDDPNSTASGSSRFAVDLRITNKGSIPIANPFIRVDDLTRNILLNRDARSSWQVGARMSIDAGSDNVLSPGETANAHLVLGLTKSKKFTLSVSLYGVPIGGSINAGDSVNVYSGKPKNR